jgi:hypothetical protein
MAMSLVDIVILRLNTRTTFRFGARMTPIRANIVGPRRDRDQVRVAQAEVEWWIFAHPKSVFRHIVTGGRCCSKAAKVHFCTFSPGTNARLLHGICGAGIPRGKAVIGKQYFVRQAAILFGIAKATKDPKISAALMDKAADLKSKIDEPGAPLDLTPLAPDIELPPAT